MVSAVLKRQNADSVIKLIHAYTLAKDEDDATAILRTRVKSEFAGYVVVDVLASEIEAGGSMCRSGTHWATNTWSSAPRTGNQTNSAQK
ncbi:hypothetical protein VAR608DRAFT_0318 [Variovorax sp. HW608]|uniref:hypothetical protein n=1 Tax=Variovorax sp. HW608 TaxID=1034889 RepID=UPI00081FB84C|nr:hypothetical protein [Variovorax sp. HW608]SCK09185.1 hypothetical protein VAR608DRAFT_0318 [Variovorax sp. HW608]